MEPDGITRVYITSASKEAWLMYPEETHHESRLQGSAAQEVLKRADFHAVNIKSFEVNPGRYGSRGETISDEWGVFPLPDGEQFDVNRKGWKHSERYSRLAQVLEKRSGKKGLTILVS